MSARSGSGSPFGLFKLTENGLWLRDTTTNNVSISRHGLVPKAPNDSTKYLDGAGGWSTPAGSGTSAPAWVIDDLQKAPASPNVADDEFGSSDYAGEVALDTGGTRFTSATAWAWNNQGTSTVTVGGGRLLLSPQADAQQHIVEQAVPGGTWKFRALLTLRLDTQTNTFETGIFVRASGGHMVLFGPTRLSGLYGVLIDKWNSPSSSFVNIRSPAASDYYLWPGNAWFEIEYDATNLIYRCSPTGIEGSFWPLFTEAAATYPGTPSHIGLTALSSADVGALVCDSWRRVA